MTDYVDWTWDSFGYHGAGKSARSFDDSQLSVCFRVIKWIKLAGR
jgi:hypothetical protein